MSKAANSRRPVVSEPSAITEIQVAGFKSISDEQSIDIRPLTILAGANSSGKSSMVQPLLLLKQTLEASYEPGVLLLNGPNVKFTSADQLLSRIGKHSSGSFQVGIQVNSGESFQTRFGKEQKVGFRIEQMTISEPSGTFTLWPEMTHAEIIKSGLTKIYSTARLDDAKGHWAIRERRCFLLAAWATKGSDGISWFSSAYTERPWESAIPEVIHLPGMRGNPDRNYPVTAVGPTYPGSFQVYTASMISHWVDEQDGNLDKLNADLRLLKLTGGVIAKRLYDVQIELYVGRLPDVPPERPENRVNIADVGLGVSQTLPVLVALHAAKPGQLVFVEQPETHLHPRAQFALAKVLAAAAKRGVRVVIETHSTILLLGVQTLVAEGGLEAEKVKLHWFQREKDGHTTVRSGDLDDAGAFGEWPQDFDDVTLAAQKKYLDAADKRSFAR